jgi:formate dehydrogenase subunit delta
MSTTDQLVYMANQIARELGSQCPDRPVAATRDHIRQFWDPRMRQMIVAYLDRGGEHLSTTARDAIALLRDNGVLETRAADSTVAGANADRAD